MSLLQKRIGAEAVGKRDVGFNIQGQEVLQSEMLREIHRVEGNGKENKCKENGSTACASDCMHSMRGERETATSSCGQEYAQQLHREHQGFMPNVPQGRPFEGRDMGNIWLQEPNIPRVAHGIKNRVNRLKGLGNAIVPAVAVEIMKAINQLTYSPI